MIKMDVILHVDGGNFSKLKEKLLTDETVNRASIVFKDAKQFGKEGGYFCVITGTEERCKKALEIAKGQDGECLGEQVDDEERDKILKILKEEEDKAIDGFGSIFG